MATVTDTGPIVALVDKGDEHHEACMKAAAALPVPLVTTWPCFTEAMYFLGARTGWSGQKALWNLLQDGIIVVRSPSTDETARMRVLMEKYRDTPMDLADASLVAAAETLRTRRIFTIDSDFRIYRLGDTEPFEVIQ